MWFNQLLTETFCYSEFKKCLLRPGLNLDPSLKDGTEKYSVPEDGGRPADMYVSVHPLTQSLPLKILQETKVNSPFITVCTDLGSASQSWFDYRCDKIIVPTEVLREKAVRTCRKFMMRDSLMMTSTPKEYDTEKVEVRVQGVQGVQGVKGVNTADAERICNLITHAIYCFNS